MIAVSRLRNTDARLPLAGRVTLACVLAALLLLSQGLGLLHRVEHPSAAVPALAVVTTAAKASVDTPAPHSGHGVFGHHEAGDADCRLLDQLAHADALLAAALPLPAGLPGAAAAMHAPAVPGCRHEASYLARAPPPA